MKMRFLYTYIYIAYPTINSTKPAAIFACFAQALYYQTRATILQNLEVASKTI